MNRKIVLSLSLFFVLFSINSNLIAQDAAQAPTGVCWQKIETDNFVVIFPSESTVDGQYTANMLEYLLPYVTTTSANIRKKTYVVLQNRYAESNGYATLVPRKMEFYTTAPQFSLTGANDWLTLLSIHELRHMTQYERIDAGWKNVLHKLYGNVALSATSVVCYPSWYFEGDAVVTETALTNSGRGRMPGFEAEQKALLLSGKKYKYLKTYYGSYDEWCPMDMSYSYGYLMMSNLRQKYTDSGVNQILKGTRWKSFNRSFKKITGLKPRKYHSILQAELTNKWEQQLLQCPITPSDTIIGQKKNTWTYYKHPVAVADNKVYAMAYGQEDHPSIICYNTQTKEKQVVYKSNFIDPEVAFSINAGKIAWDESVNDLRWGKQTFHVIKLLENGSVRTLTNKTRYYAPALSPNGQQIMVVENKLDGSCNFLLISAIDGSVIKKYESKPGAFLQTPSWSPDGKYIVFTQVQRPQGKTLSAMDVESGVVTDLLPKSFENICSPVSDGQYVYFQSGISGIDNIHALELSTGKRFQITSRPYGAMYPHIYNQKLYYSDMSGQGVNVVCVSLDTARFEQYNPANNREVDLYTASVRQEQNKSVLNEIPDTKNEISDYYGGMNLESVYGWSVSGLLPSIAGIAPRNVQFSVYAQNPTNTVTASLQYTYNINEITHYIRGAVSYSGLYPILDVEAGYGSRAWAHKDTYVKQLKDKQEVRDTFYTYFWNEREVKANLTLPFDLSAGIYSSNLYLTAGVQYVRTKDYSSIFYTNNYSDDVINNGGYFSKPFEGSVIPVNLNLNYSHNTIWMRDVRPKWGQNLEINYIKTPSVSDFQGSVFTANANLLFPGLFAHNSFMLSGSYENRNRNNDYWFETSLSVSRGYFYVFENKYTRVGADYAFPIANTDLGIGGRVYLKRLVLNLFGDYGIDGASRLYRSAGAELTCKTFIYPIRIGLNIGVRYSYCFDKYFDRNIHRFGLILAM